jgi:hypothetical protein
MLTEEFRDFSNYRGWLVRARDDIYRGALLPRLQPVLDHSFIRK